MTAAYHDNLVIAKMILEAGADLDFYNEYEVEEDDDDVLEIDRIYAGTTALGVAVRELHVEIVYYFLHQGASIDIPCHKYWTLVETAIACRHTGSIHLVGILVILLAHEELK